jgi:hypothetical protein
MCLFGFLFLGELGTCPPQTLECTLVLNARQPRMEKPGPYCMIGGASPNFKLPLPIEWMTKLGPPRLNQGRRFQFWKKNCQKKHVRGAKIEKSGSGVPRWTVPAFKMRVGSRVRACPQNLMPTQGVEPWENHQFLQGGMLKFTCKGRFLTIKIAYEKFLDWSSKRWKHALVPPLHVEIFIFEKH